MKVPENQLLAAAIISAKAEACRDMWRDHGEPVCGQHGFSWPQDKPYCNEDTAEFIWAINQILANIHQSRDGVVA